MGYKIFDLYPGLKSKSNPAYFNFTLNDLITFRANLPGWSYDRDTPTQDDIMGNDQQQRYKFVSWILQQDPVLDKKTFFWSNPGYVAVGLMLEKVTGKTYETLVDELGKELGIKFEFGPPNLKDITQTWGHDDMLIPEEPVNNYKLNWLSSAGNLSVSLPDYTKFIQLQLQGLLGKSKSLTSDEYNLMHYGLPEFSYGWKQYTDERNKTNYSFHEGNPGTFLSRVYISKKTNTAFILFANIQSDDAENGLEIIFNELIKRYGW